MTSLRHSCIEALTEYVRDPGGWPDERLAETAFDALLSTLTESVDFALTLASLVHEAQDAHGLETRHDIGLEVTPTLLSVLGGSGE